MKSLLRSIVLILFLCVAVICPAQLNTDRVTQVGRNALYFEDYVLAIQYFNQVIEAKPHLAEPYFLRAVAKYNLDDYAGALSDARRATELNPFLPNAWEVAGVANQSMGHHAEAVADYGRALELLPHNRQLLFNMALAREAAGDLSGADSTYSRLLELYPRYDGAYVGRAQLRLQQSDTIAARADLARALELNASSVQALSMHAALAEDPAEALADMEQAVKLRPDLPYLRINRAVARYKTDDLNGALADFDYVVELDPTNYAALFNRSLLRAELADNDRALQDLNRLLSLRPADLRARYNRAVVLADKGLWDDALADADSIVAAYPEQYNGYALRGYINNQAGHNAAAMADYRRARAISMRPITDAPTPNAEPAAPAEESAQDVANRFKTLLTITDEASETEQTFNTKGLRGRVQDHVTRPELLPLYQLSYYTADSELSSSSYVREIEDLNAARVLPFIVFVTYNIPAQTREADADKHFRNIQQLSALIAAGRAKPIDRFARAMDYLTLRDFGAALADIDSVVAATPDFAPAYLLRAAARYQLHESRRGQVTVATDANTGDRLNAESALALQQIMDDLDQALRLNPRMAVAQYNRGTILMQLGAWADAIDALSRAIDIDPSLGAAWFNRGIVNYSIGNRDAAIADISRAGELGVAPAYPLLKSLN